MTRQTIAAVTVLLGAIAFAGAAELAAEPYIALRTGLTCSQCHVNRTGGGGRNDFGSAWSQTQLPAQTVGVKGRRVVDWLGLGFDMRARFDWVLNGNATPNSAFSIAESQLYLEANFIPNIVTLYLDQTLGPDQASPRELFGLVAWKPLNGYAKVGKFLLPFGWRIWDDNAFIRSVTNYTYRTPDIGFEVGIQPGPLSWFISLTNGSFSGEENNNQKLLTSSAVLTFRRFRVGASGSYNGAPGRRTSMVGGYVGFSVGPIVFLGEADLVFDSFNDPAQSDKDQVVGYVEGDWLIVKGLNLRLAYGFHDPTAGVRDDSTDTPEDQRGRIRFGLEVFPVSFVQMSGYYTRLDDAGEPNDRDVITLEGHLYF